MKEDVLDGLEIIRHSSGRERKKSNLTSNDKVFSITRDELESAANLIDIDISDIEIVLDRLTW